MKELHSCISGDLHTNHPITELVQLWDDYIQKGLTFRVALFAAHPQLQN